MVIFSQRRGGVQPPRNLEITFFLVEFSNSRGGPDPRSPSGSGHGKTQCLEYFALFNCIVNYWNTCPAQSKWQDTHILLNRARFQSLVL